VQERKQLTESLRLIHDVHIHRRRLLLLLVESNVRERKQLTESLRLIHDVHIHRRRLLLLLVESNVQERKQLTESLRLIHDVLSHVDEHVDSRQKHERLAEICRRIDAKAFTVYRGEKFKVGPDACLLLSYSFEH